MNEKTEFPVSEEEVVSSLHSIGGNIRYMGYLRALLTDNILRSKTKKTKFLKKSFFIIFSFLIDKLLVFLLSRVCKIYLQSQMRDVLKGSPNDNDSKLKVIRELNNLFGNNSKSDSFWIFTVSFQPKLIFLF